MLSAFLRIFPFFHFHSVFLLIPLLLYFLPTFLARDKSNFTAILILNLLVGWTVIGWIVALVWALSSEPQRPAAASPPQRTATAAPPLASPGFFCSTCGKRCTAGERFCSSCGAALPAIQR